MTKHRNHYKKQNPRKNTTAFQIFDEYGIDNCKIELVEYYPCRTKAELEKREGEHIQKTNCVNRIVPGRTKQEYRETHKEERRDKDRLYRENNVEKLKEKKKDYYQQNKEQLKQKQMERYEENKETGTTLFKLNAGWQ